MGLSLIELKQEEMALKSDHRCMPSKPRSTNHKQCKWVTMRLRAHAGQNFYEYHSHHGLAFQNIMQVGDQKLMIDLEWPCRLGALTHTCMHTAKTSG